MAVSFVMATAAGAAPPTAGRPASAPAQIEPVLRSTFIATMDAEFKQMDADKNGILTRGEIERFQKAATLLVAQQRNVALFKALDNDKNGQLSAAEFGNLPMSIAQPDAGPLLAQVDGNHDGQATLIEFRSGKLVNFDKIDSDKDGIASVAELKAVGIGK